MAQVSVIIGAQWGDEGKGKWSDILAKEADLVARFQGGNNAGHTLYIDGQKIVLHQLPSAVTRKNQDLAVTCGAVVHPVSLIEEIEEVRSFGMNVSSKNLFLSKAAHIVTPWHIHVDKKNEKSSLTSLGSTKKGIGPTYSAKTKRVGLNLAQYIDGSLRQKWLNKMIASELGFEDFYQKNLPEWESFFSHAKLLETFVTDVETKIRQLIYHSDKNILFEGAQGTLLDNTHGTYPYVTSSSTISSAVANNIGFDPRKINKIYGIAKAYLTRVGDGPFPTEMHDQVGQDLMEKGSEFGATTQRPRRCGWLDLVALKYACEVNGFDGLFLNKLDILSGFDKLKVATHYRHPRLGKLESFPQCASTLSDCSVEYEEFEGWGDSLSKTGSIESLPEQAQIYIEAIENYCKTPILCVGTGPYRDSFLTTQAYSLHN